MARKTLSKELKARVALEALRGEMTVAPLFSKDGVHATPINACRKQPLEGLAELFRRRPLRRRWSGVTSRWASCQGRSSGWENSPKRWT